MCLSQFVLEDTYGYHYNTCKTTQPPGHRLYATEDLAIFEVDPKDGDEQTLYCQLLSLLGKCFIKVREAAGQRRQGQVRGRGLLLEGEDVGGELQLGVSRRPPTVHEQRLVETP